MGQQHPEGKRVCRRELGGLGGKEGNQIKHGMEEVA